MASPTPVNSHWRGRVGAKDTAVGVNVGTHNPGLGCSLRAEADSQGLGGRQDPCWGFLFQNLAAERNSGHSHLSIFVFVFPSYDCY